LNLNQRQDINLILQNFCDICEVIKPDRSHHCSKCKKCILKMDHHCWWLDNCIGFYNYKFFYLFLFYGCIFWIFVFASSTKYFVNFWIRNEDGRITFGHENDGNEKFHILFLLVVSTLFYVTLICLFIYHTKLIYEDRTTIEDIQKSPPKYEKHIRNFQSVLGTNPFLIFLPYNNTNGDGVTFSFNKNQDIVEL